MATLKVIVSHKRAPIGTQQLRLSRGLEQMYYAMLFSGSPSYKGRSDVWHSWLKIGFHVAVKVPPPGAAESDKAVQNTVSKGKAPEVYILSSNKETLERLRSVLLDVDAMRDAVTGKEEASKAPLLLESPKVAGKLVNPLLASVNEAGLRPDEVEHYTYMVRRALLALAHDDVTSILVSLD
jgi:hypothetical protein